MLKIGLTGGIGCGKTAVAKLFSELGAPVLDADEISRNLVEPGQPALQAIVEAFGAQVLNGGRLNRALLREIIFQSPASKKRLETILHPLVYATMERRIAELQAPYCILVIPLLLETGQQAFVDRILVVDCPVELQHARVKERDGVDDSVIARIIASQVDRAERLAAADDLIENVGDMGMLANRVEELDRRYLARADMTAANQ